MRDVSRTWSVVAGSPQNSLATKMWIGSFISSIKKVLGVLVRAVSVGRWDTSQTGRGDERWEVEAASDHPAKSTVGEQIGKEEQSWGGDFFRVGVRQQAMEKKLKKAVGRDHL